MTQHDDRTSLQHMLDHALEAISICTVSAPEEFERDRIQTLALTRLISIIGEAANRVSQEARTQTPEIPWRDVITMRNRLIHAYDEVDFEVLLETIKDDLPSLVDQLQCALSRIG